MQQISGFLRVLRFPPPIKLIAMHDILVDAILLKVALSTISQSIMRDCYLFVSCIISFLMFLLTYGRHRIISFKKRGDGIIALTFHWCVESVFYDFLIWFLNCSDSVVSHVPFYSVMQLTKTIIEQPYIYLYCPWYLQV